MNGNIDSGLQRDPWAYPDQSSLLSKDPQDFEVQVGPDGTLSVHYRDQLIPAGPSTQGLPGTTRGFDAVLAGNITADAPLLFPGEAAAYTFSGLSNFVSFLQGFYKEKDTTNAEDTSIPDENMTLDEFESDALSFLGLGEDTKQKDQSAESDKSNTPNFTSNIYKPSVPPRQSTMPGDATTSTQEAQEQAAFEQATSDVQTSTDADVIYKALMTLAQSSTATQLPEDQQALLEQKAKDLAQLIANANTSGSHFEEASGGSILTNLLDMLNIQDDASTPENVKFALYDHLKVAAKNIADTNARLQQDALKTLESSKDPEQIYTTLLNMSGIKDDTIMTPDQKKMITDKLKQLAKQIADANGSGGISEFSSSDPSTVYAKIQSLLGSVGEDPNATDQDKSLLSGVAGSIAQSIGNINNAQEQAVVSDMLSTDPDTVYQTLYSLSGLASNTTLTDQQKSAIETELKSMSEHIAQQNASGGIENLGGSTQATVLAALQSQIDTSNMTPDQIAALNSALGAVAGQLSTINAAQLTLIVNTSTNPTEIYNALLKLSDVKNNPKLSSEEKLGAMNYLKLMAMALAFMSQVRALVARLDALYTKGLSAAKLDSIHAQTDLAQQAFNAGLDKLKTAQTNYDTQKQQTEEAEKHKKLMSWLMPLVTALAAVAAIILTVVTLGIGSPLAVALIVATVALTAFTIADQTCGVLDKMCDAMGITNDIARAAMKMLVLAVMTAIIIAATAGAAAPMMGMAIAAEASGPLIAATVMLVVSSVFQSGFATVSLFAFFHDVCKMNEQDSMILTIVIQLLIMIIMAVVAGKVSAKFDPSKAATDLPSVADEGTTVGAATDDIAGASDDAAKSTGEATSSAKGAKSSVAVGGEDAISELSGTTDIIDETTTNLSRAQAFIKKLMEIVKDTVKDPNAYVALMQMLTHIFEAMHQHAEAEVNKTLSNISNMQADLELEIGQLQAALEELQKLLPGFDQVISGVNKDSTSVAQLVTNLMSLFASMVNDASQVTSNLHAQAG